jgi:hypothetical protein
MSAYGVLSFPGIRKPGSIVAKARRGSCRIPFEVAHGRVAHHKRTTRREKWGAEPLVVSLWKGGRLVIRKAEKLYRNVICRTQSIATRYLSKRGALVDVAAAQLAASLAGMAEECEVGEFQALTGDPTSGASIKNGCLEVSASAGWGLKLPL